MLSSDYNYDLLIELHRNFQILEKENKIFIDIKD